MGIADVVIRNQIEGFKRGSTGIYLPAHVHPDTQDLFVAQGLPPYTEMARQGDGWSVILITALAALVVRPSTVAMLTLWNGESAGGKSYIIDRIFSHNLVGTANGVYGLWYTIHPAGMTKPTADIAASGTNIVGNTGKKYNGLAVVDSGATVLDNGWYPIGKSEHTVTVTTPGGQLEALVEGRFIVPPQGGISITVVADVVGVATHAPGLSWFEKVLTLN